LREGQFCVDIIDIITSHGVPVSSLIVRNLDERVVNALKARAARHGRSAEAEHRVILEEALLQTRRRSLAEAIAQIPDVGRDEDFERVQGEPAPDVFT
jgi:antitoxin FitA